MEFSVTKIQQPVWEFTKSSLSIGCTRGMEDEHQFCCMVAVTPADMRERTSVSATRPIRREGASATAT